MRRRDLSDDSAALRQATPYLQMRAVMPTHTGYVRLMGDSAVLILTRAATSFCPRPQKDAKGPFRGPGGMRPPRPPQRGSGMRRRTARAGRSMSRSGGFLRCKSVSFLLTLSGKDGYIGKRAFYAWPGYFPHTRPHKGAATAFAEQRLTFSACFPATHRARGCWSGPGYSRYWSGNISPA